MKEILHSIRFVHRALVLSSLAILALSFAPHPSERYEEALPELQAVNEMPISDLQDSVIAFLEHIYGDAEFTIAARNLLLDSLLQQKVTLGASGIAHDSIIPLPYRYHVDSLGRDPSLADLYTYFREMPVHRIVVAPQALTTRLASRVPYQCAQCPIAAVEIEGRDYSDWWDASVVVARNARLDTLTFLVFASDTIQFDSWRRFGLEYLMARVSHADSIGVTWAQNYWSNPLLVESPYGSGIVFPRLQRFWSEVNHFTPVEAESFVARQLAEEEASFEIFGVPLSERVAALLAVPTVLGLLVLLVSYLEHMKRQSFNGETAEVANQLPVVLFLKGWLPEVITAVTVGLLPATAIGALFYRLERGQTPSATRLALYVGGVLIVLVASLRAAHLIEKIQEKRIEPPTLIVRL